MRFSSILSLALGILQQGSPQPAVRNEAVVPTLRRKHKHDFNVLLNVQSLMLSDGVLHLYTVLIKMS